MSMNKSALQPVLVPQKFIPECPACSEPMKLIPGQKSGAWRCRNRACRNRGGEYWDTLDRRFKKLPLNSLNQDNPNQLTLTNQHQEFNPTCCRHVTITMLFMPDGSWTCPECLGQYYPEGAPEVELIIDQKIKCTTKDIMRPGEGFKMVMSAKHKSHGKSKSGRSRGKGHVASSFESRYGGIESSINSFGGKKGA